jgi:hypothetical protein
MINATVVITFKGLLFLLGLINVKKRMVMTFIGNDCLFKTLFCNFILDIF